MFLPAYDSRDFCSRDAEVACDFGFACLSRFGVGSLPHNLSSLIGPRKVIDFQLVQIFLVRLQAFYISKYNLEVASYHYN